MNVTITLSTPEHPEPHAETFSGVTSVRYIADSVMLDMMPSLQVRTGTRVDRFDIRCVLDILVVV